MVLKRMNLVGEIIDRFSKLDSAVGLSNSSGLTDINNFSEDFFCNLLNKIFGLNLTNLNTIKLNHPSIDLGDPGNKISFQVTSDGSSKKIKETIKKFDEHSLSSSFNRLRFMIISNKKPLAKKIPGPQNVIFNPADDIICLTDLVQIIRNKKINEIQDILELLKNELDSGGMHENQAILVAEMQTIGDLIVFLSENRKLNKNSYDEDPDPKKKIEYRFSDQADFLKSQIIDLLPKYSLARSEVEDKLGLDPAQVNFIRGFLRQKSDAELSKTNGDPKKALDNLTEYFEKELNKNGKKYDYQAIKFYLLDELIKCNIFPN